MIPITTNQPDEEKKLSQVTSLILNQLTEMAQTLQNRRKDLVDANKAIWAETPLIRNMDDALNLITISSEIAQHERQYAQANVRLGQLKNMLASPYFARIDFKEDGYDDVETIYIGRNSLFDGTTFHVYDWRAPISSLYYDYGTGKASFTVHDTTEGTENTISGQVTLKRQYHIENGKLIFLFDSDLAIDDTILQQELSKVSDSRIKTIIHTIQREQNKAIRSEATQLLVTGPAGSGKTSVGLHRLAFLLYKHRGNLTSAKVRIFSPSPVFASYIDGIIPELGEENVQTLDFPALLTGYSSYKDFYDNFEQIGFLQSSPNNDPRRLWITQKFSPDFVGFIEDFIQGYKPNLDEDISFNNVILCPRERLTELYRDRTSAGTLSSRTSRVIEFVSRAHEEYFKDNKKSVSDFFNRVHNDVLSDGLIRRHFDEQKNIVISDLRNRLLPNAKKLLKRALRIWSKKNSLPPANERALFWERLLYEDALMLFYMDILMGRIIKDNLVKHILLDEAQDLSYLHHKILQRLYASQFTVLADVNQALYPEIHLHDEVALKDLYPAADHLPLTTSYRSTYEISSFAAGILQKPHDNLYQRHGEEPHVIETTDLTGTILKIIDDSANFNTIGIILSTDKKAQSFYQNFKDQRSCTLITNQSDSFEPGIMVVPVHLAKGLEFDVVICPEYGDDLDKKVLYLICTRALHRLYLLCGRV